MPFGAKNEEASFVMSGILPSSSSQQKKNMVLLWTTMMAFLAFETVLGGTCPSQCQCDDKNLRVECSNSNLAVLPIMLNPSLKDLKANNNKINKLEGALSFYDSLEFVDLSNNQIRHVGKYQFIKLSMLQQLNLSDNFVTHLYKETLLGPKAIQTLDLSKNILTSVPNGTFATLDTLVDLRLSHNKISSISWAAFKGLSRLRVLHLDYNLLSFIQADWLEPLENLRFLYLSNNMIRALPAFTFRPLKALQVLDMGQNKIHNVSEEAFYATRSVDTIVLANNLLHRVPNQALSSLENLGSVDLTGNPIQHLDRSSFSGLFVLKTLKLDRMYQLTSLDLHTFVDNIQLRSLSLSNNKMLQVLPWGIFSANLGLSEVNFVNNTAWQSLFPSQVPLRSLKSLQVAGLPFYCNCSLTWMWELYQANHSSSDFHLDQATCASVSNSGSSNVPLKDLKVDDMACADWTYVLIVTSAAILITVGLLVSASLVIYKYRTWRRDSKFVGTPCLHIKDDTMIYRGTLNFHQNPLEPTYAQALVTSTGSCSPQNTTLEPFYEVPRYTTTTTTTTTTTGNSDEEPGGNKSHSSGSSKYSSSGYIGSDLWDNDFLGLNSPAHNNVVHHGVYFGTTQLPRSPRSSTGLGSGTSGSSTASAVTNKPVFFSPARNVPGHYHNTLMSSATNSPAKYQHQQQHPMYLMTTNTASSPKYLHHPHLVSSANTNAAAGHHSGTQFRNTTKMPRANVYV
jgi:Leucine-rich repeat (LRR) protein